VYILGISLGYIGDMVRISDRSSYSDDGLLYIRGSSNNLSRLNSINAIDVTRYWLNVEYYKVPIIQCSNFPNVQVFQCFNVPILDWSIGPLVNWSIGPLVHWSIGRLVHWSIGPLVYWSIGGILGISCGYPMDILGTSCVYLGDIFRIYWGYG